MKNALMLSGLATALSSLPAMAQELEIIGKPVDGGLGFQPAATELAEGIHRLDGMILVIITAILGGFLLRMQGFAAMQRLQSSVAEGGDPSGPLAHGVMILVAGLLMLTPGFFTDAVGFALLLPPVRSALIAWAGPRLAARATFVGPDMGRPQQPRPDEPIEADYVDLDVEPSDSKPRGTSGWSRPPE